MEEEWLRRLRAEDDTVAKEPTPLPDDPLDAIDEILPSIQKGKEKAHKRTISEVVPREEREIEREVEAAQDNAQFNGDSEVNEIAQVDRDQGQGGYEDLAGPPSRNSAVEVLNTMQHRVDSDLFYTRMQVFLYLSNRTIILLYNW